MALLLVLCLMVGAVDSMENGQASVAMEVFETSMTYSGGLLAEIADIPSSSAANVQYAFATFVEGWQELPSQVGWPPAYLPGSNLLSVFNELARDAAGISDDVVLPAPRGEVTDSYSWGIFFQPWSNSPWKFAVIVLGDVAKGRRAACAALLERARLLGGLVAMLVLSVVSCRPLVSKLEETPKTPTKLVDMTPDQRSARASSGGFARSSNMTPEQRSARASTAASARHSKKRAHSSPAKML